VFALGGRNFKLDILFYLCSLTGAFIFIAAALLIGRQAVVQNFSLSLHLFIAAGCVLLYSVAVKCVFIYQVWSVIPDRAARMAPAKAVGFLFIPLFNLYWVFQALWGLSRDYNSFLKRSSLNTPGLPEPLFLGYCIISALTPVGAFIPAAGLALAAAGWILFIGIVAKTGPSVNALVGSAAHPKEFAAQSGRVAGFLYGLRGSRLRLGGFVFAFFLTLAVLVLVALPRAKFCVEQLTVPGEAVSGNPIFVTAVVENYGGAGGKYDLTVFVEGEVAGKGSLMLAAGSKETAAIILPGDYEPGYYRIGLGVGPLQIMLDGFEERIRILKPAEFVTGHINLEPPQMNIGEETTVRVKILNVGEAEGTQAVSLIVDGAVEQTKQLSLKGESSEEISFRLTVQEPGRYTLSVNGLSEILEVFKIERPDNGTVLVNEITGGYGRLTVKNNRATDAVVVMTCPDDFQSTLLAVYIRSKCTVHVGGIEDGSYILHFSEGYDWDSYSKRFTRTVSHSRFESKDLFVTNHHDTGYTYTILSVEFGIKGRIDDPAAVKPVDADQFPQL
jgi:hypothetical protein